MPAEIQTPHKMLEVPAKWTRQLAMQSSSSRPLRRACEKWSGFHLARLTPSLWKGIVRGIQSVVGKGGRKKRDKITTLCLSSKSSGGVEVFQMKLEP